MASKIYKIFLIACILIILIAVPAITYTYNPVSRLEIDFLNVSQGDAILIKTPFGQNILIDGGPDSSVIEELSKNLPFWEKKIDLIILTHSHDDHSTGLIEVIKRYDVKTFLYTGTKDEAPNYLTLLEKIKQKEVPLKIVSHPQAINFGNDCVLNILFPTENLAGISFENQNNVSMVSNLDCEQVKILFTGDAEQELEAEIIKNRADLKADILKVGHHGSDTSTGEGFLNLIKPKWAIIQVGKDNDFGHPNSRIIKRLERIGARIFRTDINGAIRFLIDDGRITEK